MKKIILCSLMLLATPLTAQELSLSDQEGYVMGPGIWSCEQTIAVANGDQAQDKAALVGWIMGAWSLSTFFREPNYRGVIEQVGGERIYVETIKRCNSAPPQEFLHTVVRSMIDNTSSE